MSIYLNLQIYKTETYRIRKERRKEGKEPTKGMNYKQKVRGTGIQILIWMYKAKQGKKLWLPVMLPFSRGCTADKSLD